MLSVSKSLAVVAALLSPVSALWPVPINCSTGNTTLLIAQTLAITYNGEQVGWLSSIPSPSSEHLVHADPHSDFFVSSDTKQLSSHQMAYTYNYVPPAGNFDSKNVVKAAVSRAMKGIFQQNFVPYALTPRGKLGEPDLGATYGSVTSLSIIQTGNSSSNVLTAPNGEADESYTLDITTAGAASIKAPTLLGVLHGLETFVQLFYQHTSGTHWYTRSAPVKISDSPEYSHRGIMIDGARMFLPVPHILRTLDAMAWNKMNRLHFHVTDSQSWPLEVPSMPDLSDKGAYYPGQVYSTADIEQIYQYALLRGIQVIMEIDMPGHSGSIALSRPELIVAYNEQPYWYWCAEPPCGTFKLNDTGVYDFLDNLWADVLPRVSNYTAYFHTGGDEVNANDSMLDPGVRSNDSAVLQPLIQKFVTTAHENVRKHNLIPLVWEEMILDWNVSMGSDVIVQSWIGGNSLQTYTSKGHKVIDSNSGFWYLDCGRGQWLDFANGHAFEAFYPFNDWCSPTNNWRKIYSYDPRAGLSEAEKPLVLGGEAGVWSETIDTTNFDSLVWPRASAVGEVLWSGRQDASGTNRSQYDASPRLSALRERMVARGVGASPIQMTFCTQAQNPLDCAYYWP
ncbi:hypothetical protein TD95_005089 [Thielaviopsis punctulata]|uniref:Beta-hexosaminidase n=1 Tax=Thielaviopsis punctulata TaxID=72032 RepID=A0A0F4ZI62_9PEZI|nr:hypothetical protein TD95_005089 [Thielaviopsis punctulata]